MMLEEFCNMIFNTSEIIYITLTTIRENNNLTTKLMIYY